MKNFLSAGPAWVSNLLAIILALLALVQGSGEQLIAFFTSINCQECISYTNVVLGAVAVILSFIKAFSGEKSKNTTASGTGLVVLLISSLFLFNYPKKTSSTKPQPSTYFTLEHKHTIPSYPVLS